MKEKSCHFEPSKICDLEMKVRPKKDKISYTKDCKEQPREICNLSVKRTIEPVCDKQECLSCKYVPKVLLFNHHHEIGLNALFLRSMMLSARWTFTATVRSSPWMSRLAT